MKVRSGFVSNSSTSSFCLYGMCFDSDEIDAIAQALGIEEKYDLAEDVATALGLQCEYGPEDEYFIGRDPGCIGDDETGSQFKNSIKKALQKALKDVNCDYHERAWRDG